MNIFFWDIDGTLIRTSKAGLYALNKAVRELWGTTVNMDTIQAAGMTDNYIARQILRLVLEREPHGGEIHDLCRLYESLLPGELDAREGWVLPQVENILAHLAKQDNNKLLLLTGNSEEGAQIKLRHFGLDRYFDFKASSFAASHEQRVDIARSALALIQNRWSNEDTYKMYVLGDTPHDIECGKAIGAYTIGIATGTYPLEKLQNYEPWWALDILPPSEHFVHKIEQNK